MGGSPGEGAGRARGLRSAAGEAGAFLRALPVGGDGGTRDAGEWGGELLHLLGDWKCLSLNPLQLNQLDVPPGRREVGREVNCN